MLLAVGLGACSPSNDSTTGEVDAAVSPRDGQPTTDGSATAEASLDADASGHDAAPDGDGTPFDFYFSGGGQVLSLLTGEARNVAVTLERASGAGVPVALSIDGLPPGATYSFAPAAPVPPATVTLTVTADAATPAGLSTLTLVATAGDLIREQQLSLEVRSRLGLNAPQDVALAPAGTTALVTEADRLVEVDLVTRQVLRTVASGFTRPRGLAIEAGGATALLVDAGNLTGELLRVALATGDVTQLAALGAEPRPVALVTDAGAGVGHALVGGLGVLQRIDLATGVVENLTTSVFAPAAIALEEGGGSALVADAAKLSRVDLVTGAVSTVATTTTAGCGDFTGSLALEAAGTLLALTQDGCLMRVNLADGSGARVSCQYGGSAFALEASGETAYVADPTRLLRAHLSAAIETVTSGLFSAFFVALEAGGTTALMLEAGFSSYTAELVRVQLDSGARMAIATFDDYYTSGVTIEPGGTTALVISHDTDLLRVALSDGTVTPVTQLLIGSAGTDIAIDEGGAVALIPGSSSLQRVALATGAVTSVGSDVLTGGVALEVPGQSVLVTGMDGSVLQRVSLSSGQVTTVADHLQNSSGGSAGCSYLAIEADGIHVLVTQPGTYGGGHYPGRLLRVNTETLAVTVLASGFANLSTFGCGVGGLALEADGSHVLVADKDNGLKRVLLPPK